MVQKGKLRLKSFPGRELVEVFRSASAGLLADNTAGSGIGSCVVSDRSITGVFFGGIGVASVRSIHMTGRSGLSEPEVKESLSSICDLSSSSDTFSLLSSTKTTSSDSCEVASSREDSSSWLLTVESDTI